MIIVWTLYILVNGNWQPTGDFTTAYACQSTLERQPQGLIFKCKEHKVRAP